VVTLPFARLVESEDKSRTERREWVSAVYLPFRINLNS